MGVASKATPAPKPASLVCRNASGETGRWRDPEARLNQGTSGLHPFPDPDGK